jgi:regulator of sirC expression with transglutaminase-like and TPR domain
VTTTRVLDYFASLVAEDDGLPLTEAALALAQDPYPDVDVQGVLSSLDALAARLARKIEADADPVQKLEALNQFFYDELGFAGNLNDYYDPDNSYLNRVLEKRRGIPISLAVLYLELAQQIGLSARGVSFPGHFLLRVAVPGGEVMLDPMTGSALSESEMIEMLEPFVSGPATRGDSVARTLRGLLQPARPREILARMLRNLKAIYEQTERWQRLLAVQQRLVLLLPHSIEEVRDRGIAFARLDYVRPALSDLERYLEQCADAEDATAIEAQLAELRQRAPHSGY